MKSRMLTSSLRAWLLIPLTFSLGSAAHAQTPNVPLYTITDLGTLGGTYSYAYGINDTGLVSGGAATATQTGGIAETAFLWYGGNIYNLGTLGGASCPDCSSEAGGPNLYGVSPIFSETGTADPNGEDFCGFGTHRQCLGAVWEQGTMTALPNLKGGNNSQALWTNNQGQTVGLAENGFADSSCSTATPFQALRFEAVVWEPSGKVRALRPLRGTPWDTLSESTSMARPWGSRACVRTPACRR